MKSSSPFIRITVLVPVLLLAAACPASKPAAQSRIEKRASSIPIRFHLASRDAVTGYREANDERSGKLFIAPNPILTASDIESAEVRDNPSEAPGILVTFTAAGGKRMHEATSANIGKDIAIFMGEELIMSAAIMDPVDSHVVITGRLTVQRAQEIVDSLNGETRK